METVTVVDEAKDLIIDCSRITLREKENEIDINIVEMNAGEIEKLDAIVINGKRFAAEYKHVMLKKNQTRENEGNLIIKCQKTKELFVSPFSGESLDFLYCPFCGEKVQLTDKSN